MRGKHPTPSHPWYHILPPQGEREREAGGWGVGGAREALSFFSKPGHLIPAPGSGTSKPTGAVLHFNFVSPSETRASTTLLTNEAQRSPNTTTAIIKCTKQIFNF